MDSVLECVNRYDIAFVIDVDFNQLFILIRKRQLSFPDLAIVFFEHTVS